MSLGRTYVIASAPYDGWAKIGRTIHDPKYRLGSIQTGNPRELVVRSLWPGNVETEMHRAYAEFRGRGEWFALPLAMIEDMADLALEPHPFVHLMARWPPERIRGLADGCDSVEQMARFFMDQSQMGVVTLRAHRPFAAHANVVEIARWGS